MDHSLAAFVAIAAVVIVTPGQDTALTIRNTLIGDRRAGVATAIGVATGQLVWTIAAAAGITALLVASEPVFAAVRLAGAAYLIWLGATALRAGLRGAGDQPEGHPAGRPRVLSRGAFRQGLLSNLGNPKMVIFFSSLLPQFAPVDGPTLATMLGLGVLFCSMTVSWLAGYAVVVARAGRLLDRPRIRRTIDTVTGTILVGFGIRLAVEPA